jgi:hypothetical protein
MSDEIKTAVGVIAIPLWPQQTESHAAVRRQENTVSNALSEDEKRICAAFGISPSMLRTKQALLANRGKAKQSLTADEQTVCRAFNTKPRELLAQKAALKGVTAIAAGDGLGIPTGGLLRAHQMVDAAHKTVYEDSADHGDAWAKAPDFELLKIAIAELQAFDLDKEEQTFEHLLNGALHVMCLLARCAPSFVDSDYE